MINQHETLMAMRERLPKWARDGILAGYRGSRAHNTYIPPDDNDGIDDIDTFQVVIRPRDWYLGLESLSKKRQYATDGEDLDILVYEIQKYVALLEKGNPNVHSYLWMKPEYYFAQTGAGTQLVQSRQMFLSKRVLHAFGGYAMDQLKRMERFAFNGYMGQKRKKIVERYGYDIKNAAHCVRLLYMGIGLAATRRLVVQLPESERDVVMSIKRGQWTLAQVKEHAEGCFGMFDDLRLKTDLPDEVDRSWCNAFLVRLMERHWEENA
jgi:predicted nucleotidyltransferase